MIWAVFHCLRNLSREHGLVYDKTSRNWMISSSPLFKFKYDVFPPFWRTEVSSPFSVQYWTIDGTRTGTSNLLNKLIGIDLRVSFKGISCTKCIDWQNLQLLVNCIDRQLYKMYRLTIVRNVRIYIFYKPGIKSKYF